MKERLRLDGRTAISIRNVAHRFTYMGLVAAAFGLMLLGKADTILMDRLRVAVSDAFAPILDVVSRPLTTVNEAIANARELTRLYDENTQLRAERLRLLRWQSVALKLEAQNRALRELVRYVPTPEASYISARVIGDMGGAFAQSLMLNAGSRDGVRKGQAVITAEGLIGRIAAVGGRSARILLITDLNSRIPVLVDSSRSRAILAGNNDDRPRLIHLSSGAALSPGDRVVTSGHGGAFPPGLPVGVVASVTDGAVTVQPFVERDRLEYVSVVDFGLDGILTLPQEGGAVRDRGGNDDPS